MGDVEYHFIAITPRFSLIKVLSMDQIELFNHLLHGKALYCAEKISSGSFKDVMYMLFVCKMARETGVQSQVESYQRQKKNIDVTWLNTHYFKVRIKGKWRNPGKE